MSKRDKLVERIRRRPPSASFDDVRALLKMYGWIHMRTKGSHASFKKPGERTLPIPVHHGRVDQVYLEHVCRLLGLDDEEVR